MSEKVIEIKITDDGIVNIDLQNFNPDEHSIIDNLVKSIGDKETTTLKDEDFQEREKEQIREKN